MQNPCQNFTFGDPNGRPYRAAFNSKFHFPLSVVERVGRERPHPDHVLPQARTQRGGGHHTQPSRGQGECPY